LYKSLKINIAETNLKKPTGVYWDNLDKNDIPYYLYLGDELVIVEYIELRKRKKGGKINQVCYHLKDGRVRHASFFKKVDLKIFIRDYKISKILND